MHTTINPGGGGIHGNGQVRRAILSLALLAFTGLGRTDDCPAPRVSAGTYDYVVVGSGPGGGVLGTNLAKAGYSVFMIEAGDESDPQSNYDPAVTWDFFAHRYPAESPLNEQYDRNTWLTPEGNYWVGLSGAPTGSKLLGSYYPRGATLGGSSMINAMCVWLPSDSDWNYHYEVTGDASWKAENMQKIFERIEHNNYLPKGTAGHGFSGFFETNMESQKTDQGNNVMQIYAQDLNLTGRAMGDLLTRDPNERTTDRDYVQSIFGLVRHEYANATRYSSRYYVQEAVAAKNTNLTLSLHSFATKVVFDRNGTTTGNSTTSKPRAVGVEFTVGTALYGGDRRRPYTKSTRTCKSVQARREVIVSGGAFNSPQLLQLSGVGPRADLEALHIPVIHDLPGVGRHLMDNQEMPIVGSGWAGDGTAGVAMVRSQHAPYGGGNGTAEKERDVFLMGGDGFVFRGFFPDNQTNTLPPEPPQVYGVSIVKGSTVGREGWVKLRSADPADTPEINFNLYTGGATDPDLGAMKDMVAWIRSVYARANITTVEPPCEHGGNRTAVAQGACNDDDEA